MECDHEHGPSVCEAKRGRTPHSRAVPYASRGGARVRGRTRLAIEPPRTRVSDTRKCGGELAAVSIPIYRYYLRTILRVWGSECILRTHKEKDLVTELTWEVTVVTFPRQVKCVTLSTVAIHL